MFHDGAAPVAPSRLSPDAQVWVVGEDGAGRYHQARAEAIPGNGLADLVAFGRPFIANPDFPARLRRDLPLAGFDGATLFGGRDQGYTDYPACRAS